MRSEYDGSDTRRILLATTAYDGYVNLTYVPTGADINKNYTGFIYCGNENVCDEIETDLQDEEKEGAASNVFSSVASDISEAIDVELSISVNNIKQVTDNEGKQISDDDNDDDTDTVIGITLGVIIPVLCIGLGIFYYIYLHKKCFNCKELCML